MGNGISCEYCILKSTGICDIHEKIEALNKELKEKKINKIITGTFAELECKDFKHYLNTK